MSLWFVAEVGRGTALVAYVYGPFASVSAYHAAYPGVSTVGNQNGYATKAAATSEANLLNTGSATTQTQYEPTGPPANENNSPGSITARTQAAGGTVGNVPNPLTGINAIGAFFNKLGESNTWIRVAKVVIGGVMLIVGIAHITGTQNALMDAARKVPLPI